MNDYSSYQSMLTSVATGMAELGGVCDELLCVHFAPIMSSFALQNKTWTKGANVAFAGTAARRYLQRMSIVLSAGIMVEDIL